VKIGPQLDRNPQGGIEPKDGAVRLPHEPPIHRNFRRRGLPRHCEIRGAEPRSRRL